MHDAVLFDTSDDGIAIITLNRPEARNALGKEIRKGLFAAWDRFERDPALRVARMESDIEVIIKTTAESVVALDSRVAEPRGPKAVCEPIPPNAPARSAALPLCSKTTIIRNRHTIT